MQELALTFGAEKLTHCKYQQGSEEVEEQMIYMPLDGMYGSPFRSIYSHLKNGFTFNILFFKRKCTSMRKMILD